MVQHYETSGVPIKAWVDGVPVEHAAWQQLRNVASMPFVHSHVAVMPDVHFGRGATVGSVIPTLGAIIPAAVGVDIGCFRGDTRIPLLDGSQKSIAELVGRTVWVYSCSPTGQVVPGKAIARMTRRDAQLVRVVVSGGDEIVCTPDHKFMLLDGTYCEAQHLRFNQSLMPLYRRWQSRDGYESCAAGNGRWLLTHELVDEAVNGQIPEGLVIHHDNVNHFDNRPDNLRRMTPNDHSALHRKIGNSFRNYDPEFQAKRMEGIARRVADPDKAAAMAAVGRANITKYMTERPDHFSSVVSENGKRGAHFLAGYNVSDKGRKKSREIGEQKHPCPECGVLVKSWIGLHNHRRSEHATNHKVISVEVIDETADVYCLQVEEWHNFALSAGVFVHNCGMVAVRTSLDSHQLPENLSALRSKIEAAIPVGFSDHGDDIPSSAETLWRRQLMLRYNELQDKFPAVATKKSPACQIGTLGGGNHFVEVCLDENDHVWIMLHSGSRGVGNKIGTHFISLAKQEMVKTGITLPDKDLAYFTERSLVFGDYVVALTWAQEYAMANRRVMLDSVLKVMAEEFTGFKTTDIAINCHHNYVSRERHFNASVLVTRKGAVSAREGELGIIPGSMGARSFIVRGKGNPESFHSCSHGAGRAMSRTEAKRRFTVADHVAATAGVECRKDHGVIDETPAAYKDIDAVMAAQSDLVDIVHTLKQILCVKG